MISITRTNAGNADFIKLVKLLDADLARRDGDDHAFYAQFNKTVELKYVVVGYFKDEAVSCGAIRPFDDVSVEVKRMFSLPEWRGKGAATAVLKALESWASEM